MDGTNPMSPEYREIPPEKSESEPGYYGTGRRPKPPRSKLTAFLSVALLIMVANIVAFVVLQEQMDRPQTSTDGSAAPSFSDALHSGEINDPPDYKRSVLTLALPRSVFISRAQICRKLCESLAVVSGGQSEGTGVVFRADGYLLTNASAVSDAQTLTVRLSGGRSLSAQCVGIDEASDLAVLKVDATGLIPAEFARSDSLEAGDEVFALGVSSSDAAQEFSLTSGRLSSVSGEVALSGYTLRLLQTDASADTATSGGPLVNAAGQIVGFNIRGIGSYVSFVTIKRLGFALAVEDVDRIAAELVEFGYVHGRAGLGVEVSEVADAMRRYWSLPEGVFVDRVESDGSAAQAGMQPGDIILQIAGLTVHSLADYREVLNRASVGEAVSVTIYRRGEYYTARIVLIEERPSI